MSSQSLPTLFFYAISAFFILKIRRRIPLRNSGLSITRIFINKLTLPQWFISATPATTSTSAIITIIHSEGKMQTVTMPTPRKIKAIPTKKGHLFLLRFKKNNLPVMNVHHIIRRSFVFGASTNNNLVM